MKDSIEKKNIEIKIYLLLPCMSKEETDSVTQFSAEIFIVNCLWLDFRFIPVHVSYILDC